MADDEQFSLCWNNFNSNLSAGFHESLCRGDLVDVTLAAEGQFVKAHRLVLSDVSHAALKDLIQFMYCGEVNVKQDALPAFISTAESLQIKGLTDGDPGPVQSPIKSSTPAPQHSVCTNPTLNVPRTKPPKCLSKYKIETDDSDEKGQPLVVPTQTGIKRPTQRISLSQSNSGAKKIKSGETLEDITSPQIPLPTDGDGDGKSSRDEFIDLPIDIATKAEPDYVNDARETSEQETYVEDDSYGDMKYDESYFTENDEAGTNAPSNFKQSGSFSETYITESGGDQSTNETQDACAARGLRNQTGNCFTVIDTENIQRSCQWSSSAPLSKQYGTSVRASGQTVSHFIREQGSSDNILKKLNNGHMLVAIKKARLKGFCVVCIKSQTTCNYKKNLKKVQTYCPACPGGNWMCQDCFDELH